MSTQKETQKRAGKDLAAEKSEQLKASFALIVARMAEERKAVRVVEPVYDDVYFKGMAWLDTL